MTRIGTSGFSPETHYEFQSCQGISKELHNCFPQRPYLTAMAKESLKHRIGPYRLYAPVYDRVFAPSFSEGHRKMYQSLDLEEGDRILEVGVGTGISLAFCPDYVQVEGIDFSESMLRQARQKMDDGGIGSNVVLSKMDAHELGFDDNTFDHSLVAHALSVVSKPSRVLSEMKRVTKVGGRICIVNHYSKGRSLALGIWNPLRKRLGLGMKVDFLQIIEDCGMEVLGEERVNRDSASIIICKVT